MILPGGRDMAPQEEEEEGGQREEMTGKKKKTDHTVGASKEALVGAVVDQEKG